MFTVIMPIIGIIFAVFSISVFVRDFLIKEVLKTETFSEHDKAMMDLTLKEQVEKGKEAAVVGFVGLIAILFMEKNLKKEKNNNNSNKKRWDLNKIDKD